MLGKNLRLLQGKPLIAHTIDQARRSGLFDAIAVSSDSPEILDVARAFGANVLVVRPEEMASDMAPKVPAILHCLLTAEAEIGSTFSVLVDLDVTSPLRIPEDIQGAVNILETRGVSNVITGTPAHRSPYFNLVEVNDQGVAALSKAGLGIVRRQDAPRCYDMNASVYVWRRDVFVANPTIFYSDTALFEMPMERSFDIDNELDWEVVSMIAKRRAQRREHD